MIQFSCSFFLKILFKVLPVITVLEVQPVLLDQLVNLVIAVCLDALGHVVFQAFKDPVEVTESMDQRVHVVIPDQLVNLVFPVILDQKETPDSLDLKDHVGHLEIPVLTGHLVPKDPEVDR